MKVAGRESQTIIASRPLTNSFLSSGNRNSGTTAPAVTTKSVVRLFYSKYEAVSPGAAVKAAMTVLISARFKKSVRGAQAILANVASRSVPRNGTDIPPSDSLTPIHFNNMPIISAPSALLKHYSFEFLSASTSTATLRRC